MRQSSDSNGDSATARRTGGRRLLRAALVVAAAPVLIALRLDNAAKDTTEWPVAGFAEPSGIVWHPQRGTLFVVGDEGDIGEVSADGKLLRQLRLGGDLEGVTVDPRTGLLYVARESHEIILELKPENFRITRRFTIDRSWKGNPDFLRRGGDGIEGLTFVPDEKDPEGGRFWVANQFDPPAMLELSVPMRSSKEKFLTAKIRSVVPVDIAPLSEVYWKADTRELLVLSAIWKRVQVFDAAGRYLRSVRVPGFMPEGLTQRPDGSFVLAQDSGGLVEWKPAADPFRDAAASRERSGVVRDGDPSGPVVAASAAGDAARW